MKSSSPEIFQGPTRSRLSSIDCFIFLIGEQRSCVAAPSIRAGEKQRYGNCRTSSTVE